MFFHLSIIDRIYLGANCFTSIFSALHIFLINLTWSSWSIIEKFEFNPAAVACFLKSLAQIEWNVPSHDRPIASVLRIELTLFCISLAALLVNVTDSIWLGYAFFSLIMWAILDVRTFVLPDPAPATIKSGPLRYKTASFWALFKLFKYSEFIIFKLSL